MLKEVLEAGITKKMVRLGSRSSDEVVAEYTLDKLEKVAERTSLQRSIGRQFATMKRLEEDMSRVMESIQLPKISSEQVEDYLSVHSPNHYEALLSPPFWISALAEKIWTDEDENGDWSTVKGKGKQQTIDAVPHTMYDFWKTGTDIAFLTPIPISTPIPTATSSAPLSVAVQFHEGPEVTQFFTGIGFESERPPIPTLNRTLLQLKNESHLWKMSLSERTRLSLDWEEDIRVMAYNINLDRYNNMREEYKEACKEYNDIRDEVSPYAFVSFSKGKISICKTDPPKTSQSS